AKDSSTSGPHAPSPTADQSSRGNYPPLFTGSPLTSQTNLNATATADKRTSSVKAPSPGTAYPISTSTASEPSADTQATNSWPSRSAKSERSNKPETDGGTPGQPVIHKPGICLRVSFPACIYPQPTDTPSPSPTPLTSSTGPNPATSLSPDSPSSTGSIPSCR